MRRLGEVTVVAPDAERSAVGHAITTLLPLRVKEFRRGRQLLGYAVDGTPADCVKIGVGPLFEGAVDLVVSGINLGSNTATNVIYSGTVSAATEARILGIPSIAISLDAPVEPRATLDAPVEPRWSYAAQLARRVATMVLAQGLPDRVVLNVNVPNLPRSQIKGIKVTRQGHSAFIEDFTIREDPRRQPYYWLAGSYENRDEDPETDSWALANGYVSITPISYDLTAHHALPTIASWAWRK
jgi:5'-nucleotidase